MTVQLPKGSTCLLVGPNGAGKTTLLKILGGKHMVPKTAVTVLGQPPFHATGMSADGRLSYLGGNWDRDIAFAGYSVPLQVALQHNKQSSLKEAMCIYMLHLSLLSNSASCMLLEQPILDDPICRSMCTSQHVAMPERFWRCCAAKHTSTQSLLHFRRATFLHQKC